ncbi:unnamed protein product [Dovyalis caffra]|uniref:Uncharacterized protein n=1 Tax=Dovyalis caffra TaxID=77055 RepID=A0AAV1QVA4_9ROSI|nr:unnamed protein product [Dovyalis caffra]
MANEQYLFTDKYASAVTSCLQDFSELNEDRIIFDQGFNKICEIYGALNNLQRASDLFEPSHVWIVMLVGMASAGLEEKIVEAGG